MTRCPASDAEVLAELIDINVDYVAKSPYPAQRSEHGKGVADLEGEFRVPGDLPPQFRIGVFAEPRSFPATIRFSNGAVQNDGKRDTHGLAIKLHDVDLPTAPKDADGRGFQDFILLDSPIFIMGGIRPYVPFNRLFLEAKVSLWAKLKFGLYLLRHLPLIRPVLRLALNKANAPLSTPYWSTTPYRLGDMVVKYKVVPLSPHRPGPRISGFNGRRDALREQLDRAPGVLSFGVLVQTDPRKQPLEDPTVDWEDMGVRFQALAELHIPSDQPVAAPSDRENALSYSPGHAAWEHFPLGAINRARVAIYAAAKKARRAAFDHRS
ncbi:MAG: hypothetical protein HKN30_06815 [Sulfitobacter sp.]|nr:hypothetical protein [Sulfitobacter sp.]